MSRCKRYVAFFLGAFSLLFAGCAVMPHPPENGVVPAIAKKALIRVTVTRQSYVFHRPWQQRRSVTQTAIGAIVHGGMVLVNGLLVANHRYIELETLDTHIKQPARVVVADYEANLALLAPLDDNFFKDHKPLQLADSAATGDRLSVWQVKPNGDVVASDGRITSVDLGIYTQNNFFLTYRLDSSLQYRFNNLTLPVVRAGKLAGLVLRQQQAGWAIEVISTSVIRHFLTDAGKGDYQGFPSAGFRYGSTLDPQLRRYIGLPEDVTGIYVQKVIKGGPADRAGLQAGDVVSRLGDFNISNTGLFELSPHGKISVVHLIRTLYYAGDTMPAQVIRNGQTIRLDIVMDHRRADEYLVPPYIVDRQPEHLIVGGLVIQELSVPYLREYGSDWTSDAPIHLLYYQQNQDYLNGDQREKIVIISDVIPTPFTIGYERLSNLVIAGVNDQPIGKLDDVREALSKPVNGFHKIELVQHPKLIFLDPQQLPRIHSMITQRYRIPIPSLTP